MSDGDGDNGRMFLLRSTGWSRVPRITGCGHLFRGVGAGGGCRLGELGPEVDIAKLRCCSLLMLTQWDVDAAG